MKKPRAISITIVGVSERETLLRPGPKNRRFDYEQPDWFLLTPSRPNGRDSQNEA